jgi:asparagine synthase (glutamine-hydrolysing)
MSKVLPRYFYPTTDVGMSLTGGLDTRMVMAGRPAGVQVGACYTYGGVYQRCYDVQVAEEIAAATGGSHHTLPLGDDFFSNFLEHAEESVWLTDGCLDVAGTHEVYYSRQARRLAPVRLTGNYGSEILRSASTFKYLPPSPTLFDAAVAGSLDEARQTFAEIRAVHPVSYAAFRQIPWQLFGRLAAAQSQLISRTPYMDNDIVSLMYQAPAGLRRTKDICLRLIADLSPLLAGIRTDMGDGGEGSSVTQFALKAYRYLLFKAEWYYGGGMPDFLTRFDHNPLARRLESLFVGSHKIEHYRLWFRDQLFDWVNAVMSDSRAAERPYLNRQSYYALLKTHQKRAGNCLDEISKLSTLELIQRSLLSATNPRYGKRVALQPNLQEKTHPSSSAAGTSRWRSA